MAISYSQKTDRELVIACQARDSGAFEELVRRYQKTVYHLLYQLAPDWHDTADLSQEVFIKVWRSINSLRNPAAFKIWLTQIVTNLFYDELRKRPKQVPTISMDDNEDFDGVMQASKEIPDNHIPPDEVVMNQEISVVIRKAMAKLPEQFRVAIVLREIEGLTYEEIAVIMKTEMGTVKSRIARARMKLQDLLGPYLNQSTQVKDVKTTEV